MSPGTRPPVQQRAPIKASPKTAEALAVLVQHLVFNLEAFSVPHLKKELEKIHLEAKETKLTCKTLEEKLMQAQEQHQNSIAQLSTQFTEKEQQLLAENEIIKEQLSKRNEDQLQSFQAELAKIQKCHEEALDILREENEAIREEIDEKNVIIKNLKHCKHDGDKVRKDFEAKELLYKEQLQRANEKIADLQEENEKLLQLGGSDNLHEIQSLRAVIELKQSEIAELRKALVDASQKADLLPAAEEKVTTLTARCEDLQLQLERNKSYEQQILQENKKLRDVVKEEGNQRRRLSQYNEELQWKLQQSKEIVTRVIEQKEESSFNRSIYSASFNERHLGSNRSLSSRERSLTNLSSDSSRCSRKSKNNFELEMEDNSPPSSPKVKGVVEKSDSVSYVLEMDESPEVVASRIVRRSFRNTTPPKSTPSKSPMNKRPRMKNNPLSLSASTSAIITSTKTEYSRSRSVSMRNGESDIGSSHSDEVFLWEPKIQSTPNTNNNSSTIKFDNNIDLDEDHEISVSLPTLPSEIGNSHGLQSLPAPKHFAGEAMVSESNSDNESTNSSSSGPL